MFKIKILYPKETIGLSVNNYVINKSIPSLLVEGYNKVYPAQMKIYDLKPVLRVAVDGITEWENSEV